ncbi:unnamed protein product [Caenorhabditis auriculariae]|uniref:DAGKc domain-containing protein n=1 Tax=Caenorhabditis auriculariae TaxID=2777116 RepID=A0A8S1HR53_9PELO|nr:unnamed protein product [Caenorhabditis auriculariae]
MSKIAGRISRIPKTLWEHKKKTAFAGFLGYLGVDFAIRWNLNQKIRGFYARQALEYGQQTISPEVRPRRVFVLVNVEANGRHCYDDFQKNAMPLFNLAGIQVDVVKADNEVQLEALAGAIDEQEADAVYVVGGDGTMGKVVTGIFRNRTEAPLPVGCYPGGCDNLWLKRMAPAVFENAKDVRGACESAMAVVEGRLQPVYAFEFSIPDSEEPVQYGVGDVGAGWFRQIEDKRKKLWYFGALKRRWAYVWEMVKRSPEPLEAQVEYEMPCSGCEKCRPKPVYTPPTWRWWHILTGTPRVKPDKTLRDFTGVLNENCGKEQELSIRGTDFLVENQQVYDHELWSQLRLRMGGENFGRFGVIAEGQRRCSEDRVGTSSQPDFYSIDLLAKSLKLKFSQFPEYIRRIYVSSNPQTENVEEKTLRISTTQHKINVFLPSMIRLDLADLQ